MGYCVWWMCVLVVVMNVYVDVVGVIVCMLIDFVVIGGYFGVGKMMVVNVIL